MKHTQGRKVPGKAAHSAQGHGTGPKGVLVDGAMLPR
jgi:hypothetical protein